MVFEWLARPMVIVLILLLLASIAYPIITGRKSKRAVEDPLAEVVMNRAAENILFTSFIGLVDYRRAFYLAGLAD